MQPTPSGRTDWLDHLDEDQRLLASVSARLIAVQAGPGAGKTETLVARFVHLVSAGIDPCAVAVVTFTRRAAASFRARIRTTTEGIDPALPGARALHDLRTSIDLHTTYPVPIDAPPRPWIGTFHELCGRIVRTTPHIAGYPDVVRTTDPLEAHHRAIAALHAARPPAAAAPEPAQMNRLASHLIDDLSKYKRSGASPDPRMARVPTVPQVPVPALGDEWRHAACLYDARNRADGVIDYDDLIASTWRILTTDAHAQQAWSTRFSHIFVDELQDTDPILTHIVAMLAAHAEVVVCGDPDQSIYGWRGAVGGMRAVEILEHSLGPAHWIALHGDYRLPRTLQAATGGLRAHLAAPGPTPRPSKRAGDGPAHIDIYPTAAEELDHLAKQIEVTLASEAAEARGDEARSGYGDCMVLARTHNLCQSVAAALARHRLPIWIDTREQYGAGANLIAWLVAAAEHTDASIESAFERETPPIYRDALAPARKLSTPLALGLTDPRRQAQLPKRARALAQLWTRLTAMDPYEPLAIIDTITATLSLAHRAHRAGANEEAEYHRVYRTAVEIAASGTHVRDIAFMFADTRTGSGDATPPRDTIQIRTMHSVKGLETRHVWSPGWNEGVFPAYAVTEEKIDEERRLALTTISRAQRTFAASAAQLGADGATPQPISRFANEARLIPIMHTEPAPTPGLAPGAIPAPGPGPATAHA